jgi:hypothetical protein
LCAVTLTKLNSLFGKVADRNEMGIRADKLFQLIQKMDINKLKLEWYRRKLGLLLNDDGSAKDSSRSRMVSRGPFIAIFKHESVTFVNMMENVARPLISRRRKRIGKGNSVKSLNNSVRYTVKSAPVKTSNNSCQLTGSASASDDDSVVSSKSPKRKKVEDKTTDQDNDKKPEEKKSDDQPEDTGINNKGHEEEVLFEKDGKKYTAKGLEALENKARDFEGIIEKRRIEKKVFLKGVFGKTIPKHTLTGETKKVTSIRRLDYLEKHKTVYFIFGDNVLIISLSEDLIAIKIKDALVSESQKKIFQILWDFGEK